MSPRQTKTEQPQPSPTLPPAPERSRLAESVDLKVLQGGVVVITPKKEDGGVPGYRYQALQDLLLNLPLDSKILLNLKNLRGGDFIHEDGLNGQMIRRILHNDSANHKTFRILGLPGSMRRELKGLGFPTLPTVGTLADGVRRLGGKGAKVDTAATQSMAQMLEQKLGPSRN